MKHEDLILKLKEIEASAEKQKNAVVREFCFSNNTVEIGDIVTDHIGSILVEKITAWRDSMSIPCCVYHGKELTKKMEPKKNGSIRPIWQRNATNLK